MASGVYDLEDSDSEYDPSKIPPAKRPPPPEKSASPYPPSAIPAPSALPPPPPPPPSRPPPPPPHGPMAHASINPHMTHLQHAEAAREAVFDEAAKDWQEVDRVFAQPMFAPTEDLEKAFYLLRKWSEEAEHKYGSDLIDHIRRRGIAQPGVTERRKQEALRLLGLRRQSTTEKGADPRPPPPPQIQTPTQSHTPLPERSPGGSVPPPPVQQQQQNDRPTIRPPMYQAPDPPRGEIRHSAPTSHSFGPPPPLPPMYSEQSRAAPHPPPHSTPHPHPHPPHHAHPQWSAYPPGPPPPPGIPEHPPIPSIYSQQSEFYCRQCRRGPLVCMHTYRIIERMAANGLRHRSSEELNYAHDRIYDWMYRGRPLEIEPALQSMIPRQEMADNHARWLTNIRNTLAQRYPPGPPAHPTSPPNRTPDYLRSPMMSNPVARSVSVPSGHEHHTPSASIPSDRAPTSQQSTPQIPHRAFPPTEHPRLEPTPPRHPSYAGVHLEHRQPPPRSDEHMNHYRRESFNREPSVPQYSMYSHRPSVSQDSNLSHRHHRPDIGRCNICNSHSGSCAHRRQRGEDMQTRAKTAAGLQNGVREAFLEVDDREQPTIAADRRLKKRKRHGSMGESRRHKVGLRRENGYRDSGVVLSSDEELGDDHEADEPPSKIRSISSAKSAELVASLLEKSSKERLVRSISKLCESNHLVLSWLKKDLQKPDPPRNFSAVQETSMITPVSPKQTRSGRLEPPSAVPEASGMATCTRCDATYNVASEHENGECRYHDGDLVQKVHGGEQIATIKDRAWYIEHHASSCLWTCCGERGRAAGCKSGNHAAPSAAEGQDASAPQLSSISDMISPLSSRPVNGSKRSDDESAAFLGQDFVRRICEAEKAQEMSEKQKEQRSPRSPPPLRSTGSGPNPSDTDFRSLPDYSPPLQTLPSGNPEDIFVVDRLFAQLMDLSGDPDRHLLHEAEIFLAQKLRLTCASYLCTKRRIFKGLVDSMRAGKEYKKSYAQNACKVDARKTRNLFSVYESVGWFDPKYFTKWAPDAKLGTGEMSDSDLSSVDEQAIAGAPPETGLVDRRSSTRSYQPTTASHTIPVPTSNGTPNSDVTLNGDHPPATSSSKRKQSNPTHILHPTTSFKPVNDIALPSPLPAMSPHHPPHAPLPFPQLDGPASTSYSTYPSAPPSSHEPNGSGYAHRLETPQTANPHEGFSSDSPETYQWRKTASGKKQQVPICPYPRSWAEADSVDRELVRLKRHEGKQWEELFDWWRSKGRQSLKNASCLAVRYSILKKNFEDVWVVEGM